MDPTADPMLDVILRVSDYDQRVIVLDERRRIARVLKANDADGQFVAAQKALHDMRERRAFAWLVGELLRVVEEEPYPEPFITLADRWIGRSA